METLINDLLFGAGFGCVAAIIYYREEIVERITKFITEE